MMKRKFLSFLFLLPGLLLAQDPPSETNMASFYKEGNELVINSIAWEDDLMVFQYNSPHASRLEVSRVSYMSYDSKKPNSESLIDAMCDGETCRFEYDIRGLDPNEYHFIKIKDIDTGDTWLERVYPGESKASPVVLINAFEDIQLQPWFHTGLELYLKTLDGSTSAMVYFYDVKFEPADPPTGYRNLPPKSMEPARSFAIADGARLPLDMPGMYYLQTDPSGKNGYAFRVEDSPYPQFNSLNDLRDCMVYISTSSEWKQLSGEVTKDKFDAVWLKAGGNENNARAAIRHYYGNIQMSNKLFTNFKEGFKTDKGLIYTIFGAPPIVHRQDRTETWEYDVNMLGKPLIFTFTNKANIFTNQHSVLERSRDYNSAWHYMVDKIRRGIVIN